jgi:hypothetical protein
VAALLEPARGRLRTGRRGARREPSQDAATVVVEDLRDLVAGVGQDAGGGDRHADLAGFHLKPRTSASWPNYVRLQAIHTLSEALATAWLVVVPVGPNGLPSFFALFLNPTAGIVDAAK